MGRDDRRSSSVAVSSVRSFRRQISRRAALAIALPVVLTACAATPLDNFDLSAVPASAPVTARGAVIAIEEPSAPQILASNRIAIRAPGGDFAYLAGAQWSNVLTQLVQRRVRESFETARLFRAVAETGTAADYILAMDIRRFEIDSASGRAVVEIAARIVAARTGRTVQGIVVSGSAPAPASGAAGITAALDQAFAEAADKILRFATRQS